MTNKPFVVRTVINHETVGLAWLGSEQECLDFIKDYASKPLYRGNPVWWGKVFRLGTDAGVEYSD